MIDTMQIIGKVDIVRDIHSKAVLSIDMDKLKEHKNKRHSAKLMYENSLKMDNLESDITNIKQDMNDIKSLLQQLIQKEI
jgi:hypothetical protein